VNQLTELTFFTSRGAPGNALPSSDDPVAAVRSLRPLIMSKAAAMEAAVRLDDEVVTALVSNGTMALMVPASVGGGEAEPTLLLDVVSEMSYADGSTGWASMASMSSVGTLLAILPDAGVDRVLDSDNYLSAGMAVPTGYARKVEGGYIVRGQFSFASGGAHAGWFTGGFVEHDKDGNPILSPQGTPRMLVGLVPREQTKLLGNWNVLGLVATGSYDYQIPEQFLSDDLIADMESIHRGGALYHMGIKTLPGVGHAGFALGVAQRILDEFQVLANTKKRPPVGLLVNHATIQNNFAEWVAQLRSARAFVFEAYQTLFESTQKGNELTAEMKADCRLATTHAAFTAAEIAQQVYFASGSDALRNGGIIQRCFRDLHAGSQHMFTSPHIYIESGRIYLRTPGLTRAHTELMTTTFTPPLP
jgi:indole-3-acetate monooxygenase